MSEIVSEFETLVVEHRNLLLRFRSSCLDLKQISPDEDGELFEQIINYRGSLLDKIELLYGQIVNFQDKVPVLTYNSFTEQNNKIMQEIIDFDAENEATLRDYQHQIAAELKQVVANTRAMSGYQVHKFVNKRIVNDL